MFPVIKDSLTITKIVTQKIGKSEDYISYPELIEF
jgi:hypothetical protein